MPLRGHAGLRRPHRGSREEASRCAVAEPPPSIPGLSPPRAPQRGSGDVSLPNGSQGADPRRDRKPCARGGSVAAGVLGSQLVALSPWQQRARSSVVRPGVPPG